MSTARAIRHRREVNTVSPQRRAMAASARLNAMLHVGSNGGHLLELSTEGLLGTVLLSRQTAREALRAIAVFEERADILDDGPDPIFARPPERLVF